DADGNAHLTGLPPGAYDVVVQASGFGDEKVLHLRIPESGVTQIQIQLHTFVMMGAIAQVVDTQSSNLSDTLSDPAHARPGPDASDVVSMFRRFVAKIRHAL